MHSMLMLILATGKQNTLVCTSISNSCTATAEYRSAHTLDSSRDQWMREHVKVLGSRYRAGQGSFPQHSQSADFNIHRHANLMYDYSSPLTGSPAYDMLGVTSVLLYSQQIRIGTLYLQLAVILRLNTTPFC